MFDLFSFVVSTSCVSKCSFEANVVYLIESSADMTAKIYVAAITIIIRGGNTTIPTKVKEFPPKNKLPLS